MITREFLLANHAALVAELTATAETAALQRGRMEGIAAERKRITELDAVAVKGHEALSAKARADGWEVGQYSTAVLAAEKAEREAAADLTRKDAPPAAKDTPPSDSAQTIKRSDFNALSPTERAARVKSGVKVVD